MNRNAPLPHSQHLQSKTTVLLRAVYEGTYLAAIYEKTQHLVLTLVGGGVFGNPIEEITVIAGAHKKSGLTKVPSKQFVCPSIFSQCDERRYKHSSRTV